MKLRNLFRRKTVDNEAVRRGRLLLSGRIAEARVSDARNDASGLITQIFYSYSVGGVDYEASEPLSEEQRQHGDDYVPGALITVRYDPRQHGNSIIV
ncbi:MAG: hypothetical protein WKF84_22660 [Pyrinomonadaceae bacterium]